jgi:hypothetical protein
VARPVGAPAGWLLACGIDVEMDTKPRTSLQKRLGYFSLMLMGVGSMLLAITVGTNSDRITTFAGLGFVLSGIAFLVITGGWELYERLLASPNQKDPEKDHHEPNQTKRTSSNLALPSEH